MTRARSPADNIYWWLAIYTLGWVVSRVISDANLDPAGNMLENYAWGQYVSWGSSKHPPLMAWIAAGWFSVFPNNDGLYHVLAYVIAAIGLLGVFHLTRALRLAPFALMATLLLSIALPYSTLAAKFNANTVLLAVWPWVVWAWVRGIDRPTVWLAALLGVLAALAMLGKYYSGVLLLTLGLATLMEPAGRRWLWSRYSLITILIGALCLVPHVMWLIQHEFPTLSYLDAKGGDGVDIDGLLRFAVAPFVFWLIPWLLVAWFFCDADSVALKFKQWGRNLVLAWRPTTRHRTLVLLVVMPWLLSIILGAIGYVDLRSHWAIPIGFAYPLLWLSNLSDLRATGLKSLDRQVRRLFVGWMLLVVSVAPLYAWHQASTGSENFYRPRADLSSRLLQEWQERAPGQTLGWTGGHWTESTVIAFYGDDQVRAVHGFPGEYPARLYEHEGWQSIPGMIICPVAPEQADTQNCTRRAQAWFQKQGAVAETFEVELARSGLRFPLVKPFSYQIYLYLPD